MSVKNSSFSGTNVADIMIHLYFRVQEQLSKFKSSEVRILKYLLTLNDSLKVHAEMIRALYLGPNFETKTHEHLFTTSDKLIRMIDAVLNIHKKSQKTTVFFKEINEVCPIGIKRLVTYSKILKYKYVD